MLTIQRPLLATVGTLMCICSLLGQPTRSTPDVAIVSRLCLWNADKAMWGNVGLNKEQVRKMQEIKSRYPAVVGGQWIIGDEQQDPVAEGSAMEVKSPAPTVNGDPVVKGGLQAEVRAVLTPRQVNKWMTLCTGEARR